MVIDICPNKVFQKSALWTDRTYHKWESMFGNLHSIQMPQNRQVFCLLDSNFRYSHRQQMIYNPSFHCNIVCKHRHHQILLQFHFLRLSLPHQSLDSHNLRKKLKMIIRDFLCLFCQNKKEIFSYIIRDLTYLVNTQVENFH